MENEGYTSTAVTSLASDVSQAIVNAFDAKPIDWIRLTSDVLGPSSAGLSDAMLAAGNAAIDSFQQANDTGICASVRLQINQQATIARSAFQANFTLDNQEPADSLQNISVNLVVHDLQGNDATTLFFIGPPTLNGLTAVDGTGTLAPNTSGTAGWTIIPTDTAAANGITSYLVEGTLSYDDNGQLVTVAILPSKITVYPDPKLDVQYFMQQNVYGDDPFTPQVETPQPFGLGLLVTNVGAGDAKDLTITSSQPQILDNKKGLLVNFNILGAQVGNQPVSPSLTADLVTIASGQTAEATWLMTSSLDGTFSNFTATYQHAGAFGGTATSLINSVTIHDMVHLVQPDNPGANGDPGFLVDSNPTASQLPDTLYLADGTTAPVNIATDAAVSGTVSTNNLDIQLTANMTSGWDYLEVPDPGVGFVLTKVVRSDGTVIPVGADAWPTHPVDSGTTDPADDLLHLFDYDGTGSYTLYYLPVGAQPPAAVALAPVSANPASGPVSSIDLTLSEQVDPSTFNSKDLSLTLNGGPNLVNSGVTLTNVSGAIYQIGGLASLTANSGVYQLTVLPGIVQDSAGELSTGSLTDEWANGNVGPYVTQVDSVSQNPRNSSVDSIDVQFDEPVDPSTFTDNALSLTRNGGPNLIDGNEAIAQLSGTSFEISGLSDLTAADGNYLLTVDATGIADPAGQTGFGTASTSWTMDTQPVTISSLQTVTQSPRSIIVPSLDVTFSVAINPATFTTQALTFSKSGGPNLVNSNTTITEISPTTYSISGFNNFIYPVDGTYTLTVSAANVLDLAGNFGTGSASESWVMDTTPPDPVTSLSVTPNTGLTLDNTITTNTGTLTLTGTVDEPNLLLDVFDGTTEIVPDAPIAGESISANLSLTSGIHNLRVNVVDQAANVSQDSFLNVQVDSIAPTATISPIAPNPVATPVNDLTITFSKPVYGFTLADLQLKNGDGPNLLLTGAPTLISTDQTTWTLGNLSSLTGANGTYTLTLPPGAIEDGAGNTLVAGASVSFTVDTTPTVSFAVHGETVSENAGSFSITVNLSAAASADVTVPFILGGTAIAGTHYSGVSSSPLVIPAGQTSATITGTLIDFGDDSVLRTLTFNLGTPTNATLGATTTNTLSIAEVPVITWANPADITSGTALSPSQFDANAHVTGTFAYTPVVGTILSVGDDQTLSVTFTPTDTADSAVDYATASATVTINVLSATPISSVAALPQFSPGSFTISWSGSSVNGIASYSVYVTDNGGTFTPLLSNTTQTSTSFSGVSGHTYGFYSIATDNDGNIQPTPAAAQATMTVDTVAPTSSVAPLPAFVLATFRASWSGSDNSGGSGLATYSVFVSDNGGACAPLLTDTTMASTSFTGVDGHTYSFYSVAADYVGNVQETPTNAQASTTVDGTPPTARSPHCRHSAPARSW